MSEDFYLIKCTDALTGHFVGFLRPDSTYGFARRGAALMSLAAARREVAAINAYGKLRAVEVRR